MIASPHLRRAAATAIALLGALLMLLAPDAWPGAVLLVLGIVLELAGIALDHRAKQEKR